ncbi:zinc-binding metallopeptidase family protein [Roseateles violae]|uniref:Zinc-binding metallopeptidase n=1 Tax=Roseateles violae TaxID=3058042 RepID=A0ABT8DTA7_9BURK|nr:putative zinc-binding metallopeptidase [Pelomonas sp. PFR6]MDN3921306.1 putative zinc-binding metallopeptidase [Pelomonas sp. PFR6]
MRTFTCARCGQRLFFENIACDRCGAALGFVPSELALVAFDIDAEGRWQRLDGGAAQKPCANYRERQVCNWMLPAGDAGSLCLSCACSELIPALDQPLNVERWARIEQAKRRLIYGLLVLGLPVRPRSSDPRHGLSFRLMESLTPKQPVMTGHSDGVITLNIAEADDDERERIRSDMHEPYRTVLGHFRHEIGHYYWDRLLRESPWIAEYRRLFGDERADYGQALQRHYAAPLADWPQRFVSAYASAHPWEDWAECWAHYLHLHDGLETAAAWGLRLEQALPGGARVQPAPLDPAAPLVPALIEQWLPVSQLINSMNRSLGTRDSYPFTMPAPVVEKLDFIHRLIAAVRRGEAPMQFGSEPAAPPPAKPRRPARAKKTASKPPAKD